MIAYKINANERIELVQKDISPSVYLDHWAWRHISENIALSNRFTNALKAQKGTLVLSWINACEFTQVTDKEQTIAAENFLEANLPQVFFMETQPFSVIDREDKLLSGGPPSPPHADMEFLLAFGKLKPDSFNLFTAKDLFQAVQTSVLRDKFNNLADTVSNRVEAMRTELDGDSEFQAAMRRRPSGQPLPRGTRFLLRELLRTLLIDKKIKMDRNHAVDLMHAIVPIAYCDFVLLDKHWKTQVERVQARFHTANMPIPIGKAFSANEIDEFLTELESHN
jgi:hypothetical protein